MTPDEQALYEAIQNDDLDALERALPADPALLAGPLALAVRQRQVALARRLIEAGADVLTHAARGMTSLHVAAMVEPHLAADGDAATLVAMLLEAGADPTAAATGDLPGTPLTYAARFGSTEALRLLSADPRAREPEPMAATLDAAARGCESLAKVELLLELGADPNGGTALASACGAGQAATALRLLEAGARADVADQKKCTPLHLAVASGSAEVVEALIEKGAPVDVATSGAVRDFSIRKGETPVDVAVSCARDLVVSAAEGILRQLGLMPPSLARLAAGHPPTEEGAWQTAAAYAKSEGDRSAANRATEPSCREDLDQEKTALPALRQAERILALLEVDLEALMKPVFRPGTWTLNRVETEDGPVRSLKRWLRGKDPYTLEIEEGGTFNGKLRRRKLKGTWTLDEHSLLLADAKLGELETVLDHEGLSIVEWRNDDQAGFTRYTFALK